MGELLLLLAPLLGLTVFLPLLLVWGWIALRYPMQSPCPRCGAVSFSPTSWRQFLWGGWSCPSCQTEQSKLYRRVQWPEHADKSFAPSQSEVTRPIQVRPATPEDPIQPARGPIQKKAP